MNITHAKKEEINKEPLQAMFERQKELMNKYHDIELKSGLLQTEDCPVNLDDKRGQSRIKDFSWRITEELGEAFDANDKNQKDHLLEELIDGLHFLIEMTILTGYDISNKTLHDYYNKSDKEDPKDVLYLFIRDLGMMCNCLKNKPWKQTQMKTDKNNFYYQLNKVWEEYILIIKSFNIKEEEIIDIYLRKSQVNKFRQRSNY